MSLKKPCPETGWTGEWNEAGSETASSWHPCGIDSIEPGSNDWTPFSGKEAWEGSEAGGGSEGL